MAGLVFFPRLADYNLVANPNQVDMVTHWQIIIWQFSHTCTCTCTYVHQSTKLTSSPILTLMPYGR